MTVLMKKTKINIDRYSQHKNIQISFMDKNKGAAFCRNFALSLSKSEYIAFLDSDDIWTKDKLSEQLSFMKKIIITLVIQIIKLLKKILH